MKNRIKNLRLLERLTIIELSNKIGVTRKTLSEIEKGNIDIKASLLIKLSNIFNVSIDYILYLDNEKDKENINNLITELKEIK